MLEHSFINVKKSSLSITANPEVPEGSAQGVILTSVLEGLGIGREATRFNGRIHEIVVALE